VEIQKQNCIRSLAFSVQGRICIASPLEKKILTTSHSKIQRSAIFTLLSFEIRQPKSNACYTVLLRHLQMEVPRPRRADRVGIAIGLIINFPIAALLMSFLQDHQRKKRIEREPRSNASRESSDRGRAVKYTRKAISGEKDWYDSARARIWIVQAIREIQGKEPPPSLRPTVIKDGGGRERVRTARGLDVAAPYRSIETQLASGDIQVPPPAYAQTTE
jgi:hypothetical protein